MNITAEAIVLCAVALRHMMMFGEYPEHSHAGRVATTVNSIERVPVEQLVEIDGGVVSGALNLESSDVNVGLEKPRDHPRSGDALT